MTVVVVALVPVVAAFGIYLFATAWRPVRRRRQVPVDVRPRLVRAAVGAVVVGVTTRWPVAAAAAAMLGWYLPEVLGSRADSQSELSKTEGIAGWTELLRDTLLGPTGLEGAIEATAQLAPEAVRTPVVALAGRLRTQRPTQALASLADELDHPLGDQVVAALALSYDCPSSELSALLTTLADTARAEAGMRQRIDTARARMRTAVRVILLAMGVTAIGLALLARSTLEVYSSPGGQVVLGLIVALWGWGLAWLARLSRLDGPARFFSGELTATRRFPAPEVVRP